MAQATEMLKKNGGKAALFCGIFFYFCITLQPFPSLATTYAGTASAAVSNALNQLLALFFFFTALVLLFKGQSNRLFLNPLMLLATIFAWFALTSILGEAPVFSLRRLIMAGILCVVAGATLSLPRSEQQFAMLLAFCTFVVLGLCYVGVAILPSRSIHQLSDALEPALAGDWRGLFRHKNEAASVMAILVVIGLYLRTRWSKFGGAVVIVLSFVFMIKSGGKTAAVLLPIVVATTWAMTRLPSMRHIIPGGLLLTFAFATIGSAAKPVISQFLTKIGVDATFTGRTDIWTLALDYIRQQPMLGYGYQAFWRRDELLTSFTENNTWATAAPDAHNGYLDIVLAAGYPGLFLLLLWIFVLPIQYFGKMDQTTRSSPLTKLYLRIWLYVLLTGFLETAFLLSSGLIWFLLVFSLGGLRLQAQAHLVHDHAPNTRPQPRTRAANRPVVVELSG